MEALGETQVAEMRLVVTNSDPETTKIYIHITVRVCVNIQRPHSVFQTDRHSRHDGCDHCTGNKNKHLSSTIPVQSIMKTGFFFLEVQTYPEYTFLQITEAVWAMKVIC